MQLIDSLRITAVAGVPGGVEEEEREEENENKYNFKEEETKY